MDAKQKLKQDKIKVLEKHFKLQETDDIIWQSAHNPNQFYYSDDNGGYKYFVFTKQENQKFLLNCAIRNHDDTHYYFDDVVKIVGCTLNQLEDFLLPDIIEGNDMVEKFIQQTPPQLVSYRVKGVGVTRFIEGKISLKSFLKKYVDLMIKNDTSYHLFPCWENRKMDEFYFYRVD